MPTRHDTNRTLPPLHERLAARVSGALRLWRSWLGILMLFIVLATAVLSVETSHWVSPQPLLTFMLGLSVLLTALLLHSRLKTFTVHLICLGTGGILTILFALEAPAGSNSQVFGIFLSLVTWLSGWLCVWFFIRRRNMWATVAVGALILFVNLSFLPGGYFIWLMLFFIAAALFIVFSRLTLHPEPTGMKSNSPRYGWSRAVGSLLIVIIIAVSLAWVIPQPRLPELQNTVAAHNLWLQNIKDSSLNIFNRVPSKIPKSTRDNHDELKFGGVWNDENTVVYTVHSEKPSYWRVQVYDIYTSDGWESSPADIILSEPGIPWGNYSAAGADAVTYTVYPAMSTDVILVGGTFITADLPYLVYTSGGELFTVTAPRLLQPGESYQVTTMMNTPPPDVLDAAGTDYPEDISRYLNLPPSLPPEVIELAEEVTAGAETPYRKMLAIDAFLNNYRYNISIDGPEPGTDGVAYFLFEEKSGFCTYFASSMAVMLRATGVPARLVTGYIPGEAGEEAGTYILRSRHYHAWVQAYFPGAGWVDLEATPGGSAEPGSRVPIDTPLVSSADIARLSQWDIWYWPYYQMGDSSSPTPTATSQPGQRLAFADELGKALIIIGLIIAAALVISVPVYFSRSAFHRWLWHVDRENLASNTFLKMVRLADIAGVMPLPGQTPYEFAGVLAGTIPEQSRNISLITDAYVERRYGRAGRPGLFEEAEILKARCAVYTSLLQRLGFIRRFFSRR